MRIRIIVAMVIALLITGHLKGTAQVAATCTDLIAQMLTAVQTACDGLASGQACLAAKGEIVTLNTLETVQTQNLNPADGTWDAVLMHVPTANTEQPITIALFGNAQATNLVPLSESTLAVTNTADYNINLRTGPSTDHPIAGSFLVDATALVDGKNTSGDWLHLNTETVSAWLYAPLLVDLDPTALEALPVLNDFYTAPMQAFTLTTSPSESTCADGSVGMLVQYAGDQTTHLQVNGVDLTFKAATLFLQANDATSIHVLHGSITVGLADETLTADTGAVVQVASTPQAHHSFAFAAVQDLPYGLVSPEGMSCIAGVLSDDPIIASYSLPNLESNPIADLESSAHYAVQGWANDDDQQAWWQISLNNQRAWVLQSSVATLGACETVEEVSPNAPVINSNSNVSTGSALVPPGTSIWQAVPGLDNMIGTCTTAPVVLCDHLAAIVNNGSSIAWRGQELQPYNLPSIGGDAYRFSGRNQLNNSNLTLTLTFQSNTSWTMTMTQVFDTDPQCTHTFYYSASFLR